ncbi:hypothetical protein GWI33_017939 [Rhynchophorus ferrugineus]|uniref:Uncharacterized protein n=1 Tax=Rhynchophorus ferrugineus TaxID=354439 RepID=A0A834HXM1_RHYFE|nr:hypothetical protein GWI33_017939 [Rhynchophorus ferrugineus]
MRKLINFIRLPICSGADKNPSYCIEEEYRRASCHSTPKHLRITEFKLSLSRSDLINCRFGERAAINLFVVVLVSGTPSVGGTAKNSGVLFDH